MEAHALDKMSHRDGHWVTCWTASSQGPYPIGSPVGQPDLRRAFPDSVIGANNQSMRMIVKPGLWSDRMRFRMSNVFGDRNIYLSGFGVGLHSGGGAITPGTWSSIGNESSRSDNWTAGVGVLPVGQSIWSPAIDLSWARSAQCNFLQGQSLAVSWTINGCSGPMSWHAKAMVTSYLSEPGTMGISRENEAYFPHTTTSCFFLDAVDCWLPSHASAVVAFGDSLTDGTCTTLNGHDRWPDVLQRAFWANGRTDIAVVNAGVGGNQIAGPNGLDSPQAWRGGPSAVNRLERDVLSLSGVSTVVWLQGINDFSDNGDLDADTVVRAMLGAVERLRQANIRVLLATIPSAFGGTRPGHGSCRQDERRRIFNTILRQNTLCDGLIDLDQVLTDVETGRLRAAFNSDSTFGELEDGVHPNRAGHASMALEILTHPVFLQETGTNLV